MNVITSIKIGDEVVFIQDIKKEPLFKKPEIQPFDLKSVGFKKQVFFSFLQRNI